jgi:peptidylprolyl isomerase
MSTAKQGDTVHVHYTGRLDDGTVFDSSNGREPLEFTIGEGQVIPGFEQAVDGMAVGEKAAAQVPPEKAYGPRSDQLVLNVQRERFPDSVAPEVGQRFTMTTEDGQQVPVTVTETASESVTIDANHPLAGKELTFDLELVKIA